jgi:large subunit ribosomal protein L13
MIHQLDATDQSLGRLASKIAILLRGKANPTYKPNVMPDEKVVVSNITKLKWTGKKFDQKEYKHYSGFPGGMKTRKTGEMFTKDPKRVLWLAVYRMLPQNRTRAKIIKNLEVK